MLFLALATILAMPYVIEAVFDWMGWLVIPNDELMPRYLALVKSRSDCDKERKATTV
jgi:hypothetical protein